MQLHLLSMQFGTHIHTHSYVGNLTNRVHRALRLSKTILFDGERERVDALLFSSLRPAPSRRHACQLWSGGAHLCQSQLARRKKGVVLGFLRFGFIWLNHPSQPSKDAVGGDAFVIILKMERRLNLLPPLEPSCDNDDAHDGFLFRETSLFFELLIS